MTAILKADIGNFKKRSGSQEPSRGLYKCDPLKKHGLSSKLQLSICIEYKRRSGFNYINKKPESRDRDGRYLVHVRDLNQMCNIESMYVWTSIK